MKRPLVSVITPCYNDGKYILETVESVKNSCYENIEHIIINDGSTDLYTLEILEKISLEGTRVIHTINQGVCKARNTAIEQSRGKYVLPLDADDLISPSYISSAVAKLESDENITIVACNYKIFGKMNRTVLVEPYLIEKLLGHNLFVVSTFFRRVDFDKIGGFNVEMKEGLEDWDFWISLLKTEGRVAVLDGFHFFYRIKSRANSRNYGSSQEVHKKLRRLIWQNHCDLTQTYEYLKIANSKEYRLGKMFLAPVRALLQFYRDIR
jgi:glycosyltransferase involved in cell wall biosynthesis